MDKGAISAHTWAIRPSRPSRFATCEYDEVRSHTGSARSDCGDCGLRQPAHGRSGRYAHASYRDDRRANAHSRAHVHAAARKHSHSPASRLARADSAYRYANRRAIAHGSASAPNSYDSGNAAGHARRNA